ncbi:adenylate/guanylate cyclase domain-containing protein [Thalassococcus sp. S3]|nr:adenylate/guanylate cyclase domain-containing protein [Thalassococcus sp. S3]
MWERGKLLRRATWISGLAVTATLLILYIISPPPVELVRNAVQDGYQRLSPRVYDRDAPVHVIDIDEASLETLGQWPWPRTYLAALTDRLFGLGAVAIGFDILLAEPDRTSPRALRENLTRFREDIRLPEGLSALADHDAIFARALSQGPTVLALSGRDGGVVPPPKAGVAFTGADPADALLTFPGALLPVPELGEAAAGLGHVSLTPGRDGITRRVPMAARLGDQTYPSLSAELLRVAQGAGSHILRTTQASGEGAGGSNLVVAMKTGAAQYPLDASGDFHVHFAGLQPGRTTPILSILADDWDTVANQAAIAGKIVLIGSSAQALFDIRTTPLSDKVPGVMIHAEVLEQVIAGTFLNRPDWTVGLELLVIAAIGLIMILLSRTDAPALGLLGAFGLAGLSWAVGWHAFSAYGLLLDPTGPILAAFAVFIPTTALNVLAKEVARRKIRGQFAHFLPEPLIAEIVQSPEETLTPKGAERELTIMFVDMRRFSTLTEKMAPEDVVRLLNTFLDGISVALVSHGATIDKYIGDAVMAFWNAPVAREDHAVQAQLAIFAIERAVADANATFQDANLPQVEARIGVNTGKAFVGLMGSSERLSYSCVGDAVTLAARLEGLTRLYGVGHLVGSATASACPEGYMHVEIDEVVVKGRTQPEAVAVLVSASDPAAQAFKSKMATLRVAEKAADWTAARAACDQIAQMQLSGLDLPHLARFYLERIADAEVKGGPDMLYRADAKR